MIPGSAGETCENRPRISSHWIVAGTDSRFLHADGGWGDIETAARFGSVVEAVGAMYAVEPFDEHARLVRVVTL